MAIKEIRSLTGIRGIASLYVAIYHFYEFYSSNRKGSIIITNKRLYALFSHGYLAVDLFFILSAFVITLSSSKLFEDKTTISNYRIFMLKRWVRVYPAYLFFVIFGFIFYFHFGHLYITLISLTLSNLLLGLPFAFGNHWSLGAEWITYLLYPVFFRLTRLRQSKSWNYILIIIGFAILYLTGIFVKQTFFPDFMLKISSGFGSILRCFGSYFIGMGAFNIFKRSQTRFIYSDTWCIIVCMSIIISLLYSRADIIIVFLFMLLIISIATDKNIIARTFASKPVYFLGVISYPVYLVHFPIFLKLKEIMSFFSDYFPPNYVFTVLFIVYMLTIILLSTAFTYLYEVPIIKMLNNWLFKQKMQTVPQTLIIKESKFQ